MAARITSEPILTTLARIRRVKGRPGDRYEVIFVDQHDQLVVGLTEWYRLRKEQGPAGTRTTYLTCLLPFFTFLTEQRIPWNASPDLLRPALMAFHRDWLKCLIHPGKEREGVEITPTRDTPLRDSTLRVMRAALRDFYQVMKDARLYVFPNPLSSETLLRLKQMHQRTVANAGAPEHAGIRGESRTHARRQPTAFLRYPKAQQWEPDLRKELADVREGIHKVLDTLLDSTNLGLREKAVLALLRNTGARLHEIVLMTVGGYRNEGVAGQAQVIDKGSAGRTSKTIYFAHNPQVQQTLTTYLEQIRPRDDQEQRQRFMDVSSSEPLFLSERGTPYTVKDFYYHWYKHYPPLQALCPVRFSPHDIRHLFITDFLILLRRECGAGSVRFDAERYQREREAFAHTIMGWRGTRTIDLYDHSRDSEHTLEVLALLQHGYAQRRYAPEVPEEAATLPTPEEITRLDAEERSSSESREIVWLHDAETLAWVQKLQSQTRQD
jgi:integrase